MSSLTLLAPDAEASHHAQPIKTAIVGLGAIGSAVAAKLAAGSVPGVELVGVAARDREKARETLDRVGAAHCRVIVFFDQDEACAFGEAFNGRALAARRCQSFLYRKDGTWPD